MVGEDGRLGKMKSPILSSQFQAERSYSMRSNYVLKTGTVLLGAAAMLWSQAAQTTAIRAGKLFDPKSGQMLANQVVLIQGERITSVGPAASLSIPAGG